MDKYWNFYNTLLENHVDDDIASQEISDLVHTELAAPSTHKVALNCPNSSSAKETVSDLQKAVSDFLDSSSVSKALESLTEDQHLTKLSSKEVSSAPLSESVHDRKAPEMTEEDVSDSLDSSSLEVSLASLHESTHDKRAPE